MEGAQSAGMHGEAASMSWFGLCTGWWWGAGAAGQGRARTEHRGLAMHAEVTGEPLLCGGSGFE